MPIAIGPSLHAVSGECARVFRAYGPRHARRYVVHQPYSRPRSQHVRMPILGRRPGVHLHGARQDRATTEIEEAFKREIP